MGKSHALAAFAKEGAFTINTDLIVAELLTQPEVIESIRSLLGPSVVGADGALDKQAVANIIFDSDSLRKSYEDLIHPMVLEQMNAMIASSGAEIVIVEVPMLFESGLTDGFKRTITIYAEEHMALERLNSSGIAREDAVRRLMCQMPITEKISRSDFTIDNNGAPEELLTRVSQIYRALQKQAQAGA